MPHQHCHILALTLGLLELIWWAVTDWRIAEDRASSGIDIVVESFTLLVKIFAKA